MSTSPSFTPFNYIPMPRPQSADAPRFDGTNLTDFLDILSCHGERMGLTLDELTPLIIAYCTPDVQHVIRFSLELHRNARSWQDAVSELQSLYSSGDGLVTYTIADLQEFCRGRCSGSPFCSRSDVQVYARCFIEISGYLREFGFITEGKVQVYFVVGLPVATRKDVETRLPDVN
jgi:hypothetical protein